MYLNGVNPISNGNNIGLATTSSPLGVSTGNSFSSGLSSVVGVSSQFLGGTENSLLGAGTSFLSGDILGGVSSLLSGLGLSQTAGNMTTSQQTVQKDISEFNDLINSIDLDNPAQAINELERYSSYLYLTLKHRLSRRSWAGQTTKAWTFERDALAKFRNTVLNQVINNLKDNGYKITYKTVSVSEQSLEDIYRPEIPSSNTTAQKNGNISYKVYTIEKTLKSAVNNFFNDNTATKTQSNFGGGFFGYVIGGLILGKIFKIY